MTASIFVQFVFWSSVAMLVYVYVGYPLLVFAVSRVFGKATRRIPIELDVTVIITAYNEEKNLRAKIENTLSIDYPREKLQLIVASDGSTDGTDAIVKEFAADNVELFRLEGRVGKTAMQNSAVEKATGEIIVFSDATTMYQANVLHAILPNFADDSVGCAAGRLIYVDDSGSAVGSGAKSYWSYETLIKESESRACSLIGVSGCLYAVRKAAYVPMYPEACSDFLIATLLYKNGLRTVYEPNAVCTELTNQNTEAEMRMRVRVIAQTFTDLWRNREMLNPLKAGFYGVQLVSHKLLRYAVPLFLTLILLTSLLLAFSSTLFAVIAGLQLAFYLLALIAWFLQEIGTRSVFLALPLYFVLGNLASIIGFYRFLSGKRYANWEPIRGN